MEQISEELKSLDEMLAGGDRTDGTAEETTGKESTMPTDDILESHTKGVFSRCSMQNSG